MKLPVKANTQNGLGLRLTLLRTKARISGKAMAYALGISPQLLSSMEHGQRRWSKEREAAYRGICQSELETAREAEKLSKT